MYGSSYYGYGYGSGVSGTFALILGVIAIIAFFALCILGYMKFLGKNSNRNSKLGKFFHFDHFYIEQFLRILFLINTVAITVTCAYWMLVMAFSGSVGMFFLSIIGFPLLFVVCLFLNRIVYEGLLIGIRQAVDVRALRSKVVGDVPAASNPAPTQSAGGSGVSLDFSGLFKKAGAQAGAQPGAQTGVAGSAGASHWDPAAPSAPSAQPAPSAYAPSASKPFSADSDSWTCGVCGGTGNGAFCGRCGNPRP